MEPRERPAQATPPRGETPTRRLLTTRGRCAAAAVLAAVLGFAVAGAPVRAQEKPPAEKAAKERTPDERAAEILAALRAKDDAKLKTLGESMRPDPWIVSDLLLSRGEEAAASAYSTAATRQSVGKLAEYVAARKDAKDDAAARQALASAAAALAARKPGDALAALDAAKPRGGDVVSILISHTRGLALRASGRADDSIAVFRGAAEAADKLGWMSRASEAYYEEWSAAFDGGKFQRAVDAGTLRVAIEEKRGRKRGMAESLVNVGVAMVSMNQYDKAMDVFQRVIALSEDSASRSTAAAGAYLNIAAIHERKGSIREGLEAALRARKIAEDAKDDTRLAMAFATLGTLYAKLGDTAKATEMNERSAAMSLAKGGPSARARAFVLLGWDRVRGRDHPGAIELFLRARAASKEAADDGELSEALLGLGTAHLSMGDNAKALDALEPALALCDRLGRRREAATTLQQLAVLHLNLGDPKKALECSRRALAALEEVGDAHGAATVHVTLGNVRKHLGEADAAAAEYELARKIAEEKGFRDVAAAAAANLASLRESQGMASSGLAALLPLLAKADAAGDVDLGARLAGLVGAAYHHMGDEAKALEYTQRSLTQALEIRDRELVAGQYVNLALERLARRENREAADAAMRAVAESQLLFAGLGDQQTTEGRDRWDLAYAVGVSAAGNLRDASLAAHFVETARAGALVTSLRGREALRSAGIPEALRDEETRARTAETAAVAAYRAALGAKKVTEIAKARKALDAARDGVQNVVARIQREAKAAAGFLYGRVDAAEAIQSRLRADEALVLYTQLTWDRTLAIVLTNSGSRIVDLGLTKDVAAACAAFTPSDASADTGPAAEALRKLAVEPLGLGSGVKRVLVAPDGALSYVPFALLLGDREVGYVPSGTVHGLLLEERAKRGEGVLALGDPDYGAKPETPGAVAMRSGMNLVRLPASGAEAKSVGDVVRTGADATEAELAAALATKPRWHAVHLACHGLVDAERPARSALALTPSGDDDGFLTALDVFRMRVPSDLVVLSACETGRGRVYRTEGIVGLTQAFMFAGAPRVVVSMWKVDDAATAALMTKFYEGWKKGLPATRSLREAQAFVRSQDKWRHPYYWAAWSLWGLAE